MKTRSTRAARAGLARSLLSCAVVATLAVGVSLPVAAQQAPADPGRTGNPDSWLTEEFNADWGLAAINAQYAYARGLTGRGVRLGIFDSGVALGHNEFAGKQTRSIHIADLMRDGVACANTTALAGPDACFSSDGGSVAIDYFEYTDDDRALVQYLTDIGYFYDWVPEYLESLAGFHYGTHGTHVAGTMTANRDGNGTQGVAFGADFSASRLFSNTYQDLFALLGDPSGQNYAIGPDSSAVQSMYAQMAAQGVRAINHSWGLSSEPNTAADMDELYSLDGVPEYFQTYADPSLNDHILQVFAAGNNSGDIAGIYATLPRYVDGLEKYWVSVVNINETGEIDSSSSICGLSKDWCVAAPGTDIGSTVVSGSIEGLVVRDEDGNVIGLDVTGENPEYDYGLMTGTSMAAPHVTGALALLMERFPYLDNPQVRDVLLTTATDLGDAGVDDIYGWGLIDLKKAIEGPGLLRVDTDVVMNTRAGGIQTWSGLAWDDWTNDIGGPGRLTKSGIGWLRLSGDNAFAGATVKQGVLELTGDNTLTAATNVDGGVLLLGGRLDGSALTVNANGVATINGAVSGAATRVNAGGRIGGNGALDGLSVYGTIAPGNSIGTLHVNGTYVQGVGSFFDAELGANGASDRIAVDGNAVLQGGTVRLLGAPGTYLLGQQYTLLTANSGVAGQFQTVDRGAFSPFLRFDLAYAPTAVGINVVRGMALADAGATWNQRQVGAAADATAMSNPLLTSLTQLFPAQAQPAFDALSGEAHASTRGVLIDASRHVRDAALSRGLSQAAPDQSADGATSLWAQGMATDGHVDADGNAARIDAQGSGIFVGADHAFAGNWTIGGLLGSSREDLAVPARGSRGDTNDRHVALYGGGFVGPVALHGGIAWSSHAVDMRRRVAFADVDQTLTSDYDARTTQAFVEGSYRFGSAAWSVEPYGQLAQVRVDSDRFTETGGSAALTVDGDSRVNLASAGVRFAVMPTGSGQTPGWFQLRGGVGYRHASGDLDSPTTAMWNGGGAFVVHGATLVDNAWTAEAGIGAWLSPQTLVELGYSGQYGDEASDHRLDAKVSVQF
ncbi:autotransporter domain-containing protein [Lysobacter sp. TY2-98]|uniref:autotransporter domain-containing protein n=1 Tax=Lysobacter sp. TY2-98 TaxID=2290922 RepID=UPI000E20A80D|nr:autotransporter serine protease [Lysobacter sp. TY2-98]AXK73123.1 autotransporter domain-containing protein [Lysobacter sp. TY2-98]